MGSFSWPAPTSLYGQGDYALTGSVEVLLSRAYVPSWQRNTVDNMISVGRRTRKKAVSAHPMGLGAVALTYLRRCPQGREGASLCPLDRSGLEGRGLLL